MATIPQLSVQDAVNPADQLIVYSTGNGQARRASVNAFIDYVADQVDGEIDAINNRIYPGEYASDPTTRPDGTDPQGGDQYFNSTIDLIRIYNGTSWYTPGLDAAAFAAPGGSALVGHASTGYGTGSTVKAALDAINNLNSGSSRIGFNPMKAGSISRTVDQILGSVVHISSYGVTGNGVTDDTAAIQACFDANPGRTIYFPATDGGYKVTTIAPKEGTTIIGDSTDLPGGSTPSTTFQGTPGSPVFFIGGGAFPQNFRFRDFEVKGGTDSFQTEALKLCVYLEFTNIRCSSASNTSGLHVTYGVETMYVNKCLWGIGSPNGFLVDSVPGIPGGGNYLGACYINDSRFGGGAGGAGVNLNFSQSNFGLVMNNVNFDASGGDGLRIFAPVSSAIFNNVSFEGMGTGSLFRGEATALSVAGTAVTLDLGSYITGNGRPFTNGDTVTIEAAGEGPFGLDNTDFVTTILSGGGTANLVLASPAPFAVNNVKITNQLFSSVVLGANPDTGLKPSPLYFYNCSISGGTLGGKYSIDNSAGAEIFLRDSVSSGNDVYDPVGSVSIQGIYSGKIRTTSQYLQGAGWRSSDNAFGGGGNTRAYSSRPPSSGGAPGIGFINKLLGTGGGFASGTFGRWLWAKTDNNPTYLAGINGDTEALEVLTKLTYPNTGSSSFSAAGTLTLPDNTAQYQNTNAATIASFTLTTPATPAQFQMVEFATNGIITTFTLTANAGQSLGLGFPVTLAAGQSFKMQYIGTTWYRK